MSQPVIVVQADPPEPDQPSADFAAGAATVVAAAAADVATEAADQAANAASTADAALSEAVDAELEVALAHDRIDRIEALIVDLVDVLNEELPQADLPEPDDGAPPPVTTEPEPVVTDTAPQPKRRRSGRWGADAWFGQRD